MGEDSGIEGGPPFRPLPAHAGFAGYLALDFLVLFGPALPLASGFDGGMPLVYLVLSTGVYAAVLACLARGPMAVMQRRMLLAACSGASYALAFGLLLLAPASHEAAFLGAMAWVLLGIGRGGLMVVWASVFSMRWEPGASFRFACSALCAAAIAFVAVGLDDGAFYALCALLAIATTASAALASRGSAEDAARSVHLRRFSSYITENSGALAMQGAAQGFLLAVLASSGKAAVLAGLAALACGALAALASALSTTREAYDLPLFINRVTPLFIASLIFFPFLEGPGRTVCCCIAAVAIGYRLAASWAATTASHARFRLNPVTHAAYGRLPGALGLAGGYGAALLLLYLTDLSQEAFSLIVVVAMLAMLLGFSLKGSDAASQWRASIGSGQGAGEVAANVEDLAEGRKLFEQKCLKLIEESALTPRESEVFMLLAKGRNADHISKALVIAPATVKTHIYHIYMKLGISSQQTLIDMVEQLAVDV